MDLSYILNSPDVERVARALETLANNSNKSVLTDDVKSALLQLAQKVAYVDGNGQQYYNALYAALYSQPTPTPGPTPGVNYIHVWDFKNGSLIDSVGGRTAALRNYYNNASLPHIASGGVVIDGTGQGLYLGQILLPGRTIEIDVANFDYVGNGKNHIRILTNGHTEDEEYTSTNAGNYFNQATNGGICYRQGTSVTNPCWSDYFVQRSDLTRDKLKSMSSAYGAWAAWEGDDVGSRDMINGKTLKIVFDADGQTRDLYVNGIHKGTHTSGYFNYDWLNYIYIGCLRDAFEDANGGPQCYNLTIGGIRVYENS